MPTRGIDQKERTAFLRLKELVLLVAARSKDDSTFGATKLNKLLFFADFRAYTRLGEPITGAPYVKRQFGPCPRDILRAVRTLVSEGRAREIELSTGGGYTQRRVEAIADPDPSMFSPDQVAVVDDVIGRLRHLGAVSVSDFSHRFTGWKLAADGEEIPYFTALIGQTTERPLSPAELVWANAVASKIDARSAS